jgi:CheY-like chemotaxis protein
MAANTVLIVSDDAADAKLLEDTLATARDGPFVTEWVRHLSDAVNRLGKHGVDIILVDLFLPDSHGLATFDVLFKVGPPIPIMTLCNEEYEPLAMEAVPRVFSARATSRIRWCRRPFATSSSERKWKKHSSWNGNSRASPSNR